jgi:hypothetical protein
MPAFLNVLIEAGTIGDGSAIGKADGARVCLY